MARLSFPHSPNDSLDFTLTLPPNASTDTLVIYLHGFASDQLGEKVLYLRDQFIAAGCAYLAFDHRGHGRSSGTLKELTVSRNLEDLEAVLVAEGAKFQRCILVGSSMGGLTAAWYAARHPGRVAANLLIAPGFRFIERRIEELGAPGLSLLKRDGEIVYKNEYVCVTIGKALFDDAPEYTIDKLFPAYRTPTLIIHGTADESVPFDESVEFVQYAAARPLELLLIAGGDHRLNEYKETLFSAMREFLRRHRLLP
ncbi:MAG: alpha/beta fold hydrolase [Nitrospirota bacterium]